VSKDIITYISDSDTSVSNLTAEHGSANCCKGHDRYV